MDKHPISDLMETTMQKIREMVDVNTIVGQPIQTADGITLLPVSKVTSALPAAAPIFRQSISSRHRTTPSAAAVARA
jgi:uncharacterized spore protein YtfJ